VRRQRIFATTTAILCQTKRVIGSVETDRLVLRPITVDDVDLLVDLDSDPEVMRYLTGRPSTRLEIETVIRDRLGWRWIATERLSGAFVGWFGLVPGREDSYDIGYRLGRMRWGRGLASEGTKTLIDAAFRVMQARRVTAQTMAVNVRSRAVMARCGMRHSRTFHQEWDDPLPGTEHGEVEYEITRAEWEDRSRSTRPPSRSDRGRTE
jgi:RimJ/RimL family protein N-acetyltransferase